MFCRTFSIDGEAVLRRKKEREQVLKLRTVLSYVLNEKGNICEGEKYLERFKSADDVVWKLFPSLHRLFQMDNLKGISNLSYKQFIINLQCQNRCQCQMSIITNAKMLLFQPFQSDQNSKTFVINQPWWPAILFIITCIYFAGPLPLLLTK